MSISWLSGPRPKTVTNDNLLSDLFHQCDHHRLPAETLAQTLAQHDDVRVVIHDLPIAHGDVLAQVMCFQLDMALLVGQSLL